MLLTGCSTIHEQLAKERNAPTYQLKGYGVVNKWMNLSDSDIMELVKYTKSSGGNCVSVELLGSDEGNNPDKIKKKFKLLINEAKYRDVVVFVNIVNWNYSFLVNQSDAWFQDWLDYLKDFKKGNMVVQACSEWSDYRNRSSTLDARAARWCKMAEDTLTGFSLSWNKGSRPSTATSRYAYIDYHSSKVTDLGGIDKRIICNTDHTVILKDIQNGGLYGQTFKTDKIITYATPVLKAGKSVNLYGYLHTGVDKNAIKTLGKIK